jgi:hypothetical protein
MRFCLISLALFAAVWGCQKPADRELLVGRVLDDHGPVAAVRVRSKGQSTFVLTDEQGRFQLPPSLDGSPEVIAASKAGYFIQGLSSTTRPLEIRLQPLPAQDNVDYHWVDPTPDPAAAHNCGNCHAEIYREWKTSGHATSLQNRHFLNLLEGTDWQGRDDRGWNLAAEHPDGLAVCSSCHAPTVSLDDPALANPRLARGADAHGIHCDLCHKIQAVDVENVGFTHGRFAFKLLRPGDKQTRTGQLFFGPLDDVDRGEDVYLPEQRESRHCAACHEGVVFGVSVYSTYSEWLASPARQAGKQCQTCHMTPTGNMTNVAPQAGGIERRAATLASHSFLPGGREQMLKNSVRVSATLRQEGEQLHVRVNLVANDVGHRVPTGFIDRHLLMIVEGTDAAGQEVSAESGPRLPSPAGEELSGQSGRLFAKLLVNAAGVGPQPFWRAGLKVVDTRLNPQEPVNSEFVFHAAAQKVRVRLIYRRFWAEVAKAKDWPDEDILVFDQAFTR